MNKYTLKLFIAGQSLRSKRAIRTITQLVEEVGLGEDCELLIIDILEHPDMAENSNILATPTLLREHPLPQRRFVGDLTDIERLKLDLEFDDIN